MTEAKAITEGNDASRLLTMIESVDPSDTDTLDQIDALVWCYINNEVLTKHKDIIGE